MSSFGKPNATGRSSGKFTSRKAAITGPPKDQPWAWLSRDLLKSPAWRHRSVNCARIIDFLMLEHTSHAGTENGNLLATHEQLKAWGVTRRHISPAINEAVFLGLIRVERGGRRAGKNAPSRFRLTFYHDKELYLATNEWKQRTTEEIKEWKNNRSTAEKARKSYRAKTVSTPRKGGTVLPFRGVRDE